jgi:hypothetical protein
MNVLRALRCGMRPRRYRSRSLHSNASGQWHFDLGVRTDSAILLLHSASFAGLTACMLWQGSNGNKMQLKSNDTNDGIGKLQNTIAHDSMHSTSSHDVVTDMSD